MSNCSPTTGVRYGVISVNSLDPDIVETLFYGPDAVDLSYQEAYNEAKAKAEADWDDIQEQAEMAAAEVDHWMSDHEKEKFIEKWIEDNHTGHSNREDFVDMELEAFSDMCQIEEPVIEGEYEGVKYRLSCLGGAYLLWALEGPLGCAERLCSPCVPNAADLNSGFILDGEFNDEQHGQDYSCYCVPREWLDVERV